MISDIVFYAGMGWLAVMVAVIVIVTARGRTTATRILALNLLTMLVIGLLALIAGEDRRSYVLDAALALALLSFVSTLAACRYLEDRRPFR